MFRIQWNGINANHRTYNTFPGITGPVTFNILHTNYHYLFCKVIQLDELVELVYILLMSVDVVTSFLIAQNDFQPLSNSSNVKCGSAATPSSHSLSVMGLAATAEL